MQIGLGRRRFMKFISFVLVIGIVAAVTCFVEIVLLLIRYVTYKCAKKKRKLLLACGFAIRGREFAKGVCQAIIANGLAATFSLLAGAIGMLVPVPGLNVFISIALSTVGYMLGQYLTGVIFNFGHRYKYLKNKAKKDNAERP